MTNKNAIVLKTPKAVYLVSYETLVACYNRETATLFVTEQHWSKTTSGHLNDFGHRFVPGYGSSAVIQKVSQDTLDNIASCQRL
jgi:hypothetical protein